MSDKKLLYFAYGSNLLLARLRARTPSIESLGMAALRGHAMNFNKPGGDGSGKCGIEPATDSHVVFGVVYAMAENEKQILDEIEGTGHGYTDGWIDVNLAGESVRAFTYFPTRTNFSNAPYDWYKGFVLAGAIENALPDTYINRIRCVKSVRDPDAKRRRENLALLGDFAITYL